MLDLESKGWWTNVCLKRTEPWAMDALIEDSEGMGRGTTAEMRQDLNMVAGKQRWGLLDWSLDVSVSNCCLLVKFRYDIIVTFAPQGPQIHTAYSQHPSIRVDRSYSDEYLTTYPFGPSLIRSQNLPCTLADVLNIIVAFFFWLIQYC